MLCPKTLGKSKRIHKHRLAAIHAAVKCNGVQELQSGWRLVVHEVLVQLEWCRAVCNVDWLWRRLNVKGRPVDGRLRANNTNELQTASAAVCVCVCVCVCTFRWFIIYPLLPTPNTQKCTPTCGYEMRFARSTTASSSEPAPLMTANPLSPSSYSHWKQASSSATTAAKLCCLRGCVASMAVGVCVSLIRRRWCRGVTLRCSSSQAATRQPAGCACACVCVCVCVCECVCMCVRVRQEVGRRNKHT